MKTGFVNVKEMPIDLAEKVKNLIQKKVKSRLTTSKDMIAEINSWKAPYYERNLKINLNKTHN